jgi:hypothetical protein
MATENVEQFDAIIPYHYKDEIILPYCLESLRKNTRGLRKIYVISKEDPDEECIWIPEASFPFSFEDVSRYIHSTNNRQGWYYQQLLKYYAYKVIPDLLPNFLIPDSDVVFLRPIEFFKNEKILFDYGGLYVPEYFTHMRKLLPKEFENTSKESGTTDCMMYNREILDDLFKRVEKEHGCPMWEALLKCVEPDRYNTSGMSEQEIYFQFALEHYPDSYQLRLLEKSYGVNLVEMRRTDLDFLSFHAWLREHFADLRSKALKF